MKHFLVIETCSERGCLAYGNSESVFFEREIPLGLNQSQFFMPYLETLWNAFDSPFPVDAIGVGIGPGSYTGIRLGVAAAQTLAYSWKVPLVGLCSLEGFVPKEFSGPFAALIDARMGGSYFQKGTCSEKGVHFSSEPQIHSLEEIGQHLKDISHLVTPNKSLEKKFKDHYPQQWAWEERSPSPNILLQVTERKFAQGQTIIPPQKLDIFYLRREK